jgi:hypothetical protein
MGPKSKLILTFGGMAAAIAILGFMSIFTTNICDFKNCDSDVVITSVVHPELVEYYQNFEIKVNVLNTGESAEKDCVVHLNHEGQLGSIRSSAPFDITPGEKLNVTLENSFSKDRRSIKETIMVSWVACDNIESERYEFKIDRYLRFDERPFWEGFNSENP